MMALYIMFLLLTHIQQCVSVEEHDLPVSMLTESKKAQPIGWTSGFT